MTIFTFESLQFDIASEPENEINPIFGYSAAEHIRLELAKRGYDVSDEVGSEDWGWYFYATMDDQQYMVGTCSFVDADEETGRPILDGKPIENLVQFEKQRSFKEIILGRNKLTDDDPFIAMVEDLVKETVSDINFLGRN